MDSIALTQVIDFSQNDERNKSNGQLQNDERCVPCDEGIADRAVVISDGARDADRQVTGDGGTGDSTPEDRTCLANTQGAKKKTKRVKFPENSLVSGRMEPPNPWLHASNCTTDILVEAYKRSCERHGVKPLARLLSQLMAVNNFQDRNETLSLRGEKMDAKHCETLEEVLRRVQFRMIDMEGTHLEDEGAIALYDMIEYYQSCTKLNISFNKNMGLRGWQACARMLKKTPCLEYLDARSCNLTEQTMATIGRSIRIGSHLSTLHLENSYLSGRLLLILVAAVKMNESLREVFLADNRLMPSDGIQLGNLLKFNHKLQLLDIRNNHLQDVGTSHLCDGLYEQSQGSGLNTLVLWNNQITYQAMTALSRAIISTKSIETLNLGHNNLTNEGVHRLKEGLLKNKSLLRVGIQACKVTCEGAVALAEFLAESKRLLRIDVRENDIKTGGLMALSLALKVNNTVTRIDIDKEAKRENGVKDYAETQKQLLDDINKYLQRNRDKAREIEEMQQAEEREKQRLLLEEEAKRQQEAEEEEEAARLAQERAQEQAEQEAQQQCEHSVDSNNVGNDDPDNSNEVGTTPSNLDLEFDSLLSPRQQTLESPEFMPEEAFPIPGIELAVEAAEGGATSHPRPEEVKRPAGFSEPLSASVTDNNNMLSPLSQSAPSPPLSPNSRKFIISKVHETKEHKQPHPLSSCTAKSNQSVAKQDTGPTTSSCVQSLPTDSGDQLEKQLVSSLAKLSEQSESHSSSSEQDSSSPVSEVQDSAVPLSSLQQHSDSNGSSQSAAPLLPSSGDTSHHEDRSGVSSEADTNLSCEDSKSPASVTCAGETGSVVSQEKTTPVLHTGGAVSQETTPVLHMGSSVSQDSEKQEKTPPALHTSLTVNGMRTELASVLDSLNDANAKTTNAADTIEDATGPDEFERELDAMLAQLHVVAPPLSE